MILKAKILFLKLTAFVFAFLVFAPLRLCGENIRYLNNNSDSIKILTWNIFMRPRFWLKDEQVERAHAIVNQLKEEDADVVVLQEVFDNKAFGIIEQGLKDGFNFRYGPGKGGIVRLNSGVYILSKWPIINHETVKFGKAAHADRFANKSVHFIEAVKNGKIFQVFGTHLQAQNGEKYRRIRTTQFNVMAKLRDKHFRKGVPQIFAGDMNTPRNNDGEYKEMVSLLDAEDGDISSELKHSANDASNDVSEPVTGNPELIDYILLRKNESRTKMLLRKIVRYKFKRSSGREDLSDHYALKAVALLE